mmetsp:Transcript_30146/g.29433  ORF Transcript_30146/g.29433 Transcript_30146/m.29433 type:complete len:151 (-) Transcript_30146:453-905(-)
MYNSVRYTTFGFVHCLLKLRIKENQPILKIQVTDSGCGMEENSRVKLFQLFQNMKGSNSVNQHGIGLGLAICKNITDAFQGSIKCLSSLNLGTQMKVRIPIELANDQEPLAALRVQEESSLIAIPNNDREQLYGSFNLVDEEPITTSLEV